MKGRKRALMQERRLELGMTMKQAAEAAGITSGYWSLIESQGEMPTLTVAGRMCKVLKMKPEDAFEELAPQEVAVNETVAS